MWLEMMRFELVYRAKRPDTYLYFLIILLMSIIGVDFVYGGVSLGDVKTNAPYVIAHVMAVLSCFFMIILSMISGTSILRDYEYNMQSFIFSNPLKKRDYLIGRFMGSFAINCLLFSGILLGMLLGEFMPWRSEDSLLPFSLWPYLQAFLYVVIPTVFYGSAVFFASGTLTRNLILVYTQGIFFFIILMMSKVINDPFIAGILDPFSFNPIHQTVELWTIPLRNTQLLPIVGILLYNRIFWILIGFVALGIVYYKFKFRVLSQSGSKRKVEKVVPYSSDIFNDVKIPIFEITYNWKTSFIQLFYHSFFYCKMIIKEKAFIAIVLSAMVIIFINSINLENIYGINSYPKSYLIIEELQEMSLYFFLIILLFYSGELIWKERSIKFDLIHDSLPVSNSINLVGKFIGLMMVFVVLTIALIAAGIIFQAANGYYQFELGIYISGFFLELFPFLVLFSIISFLFQVFMNSKYLAQLCVLVFAFLVLILDKMGLSHNLIQFGGDNLSSYSDMNGYGHFLTPYLWFKSYWIIFGILLLLISAFFSIRGKETGMLARWKLAKTTTNASNLKTAFFTFSLFILVGSYIFYNTNILNEYWTPSTKDSFRVSYEQSLKPLEQIPQPKIVSVILNVELFPLERNFTAEGAYVLVNKHTHPLTEVHIQKRIDPQIEFDYLKFEGGAKLNKKFENYHYYIYELNQALEPGDSIKMVFKQSYITKGFAESNPGSKIIYNGTFFNQDHLPTLGYNSDYELKDKNIRKQHGLEGTTKKAKRDNTFELSNAVSGDDGYKIDFEIIIGTDASQTAIAPGDLKRTWKSNNRNYFHYKPEAPIINFYSIVSADYEIFQDNWKPKNDMLDQSVQLEIYYHKGHEYNLHRMMKGMKYSLDYFSKHFSPYKYKHVRIMEVPRYVKYAQSYPGSIPYSESLGFMMNINDSLDVDMPFFITAHEVAHQWWGLHLVAANVEGKGMLLESLAQYSAIAVMKQFLSEEEMKQLMKNEMSRYLSGRANDLNHEVPLAQVDHQDYIAYQKGGLNLYALQHYISEDSMNVALKRFIRDWNGFDGLLQKDRYATSRDLIGYLNGVTPDSLKYLIGDLFETVTYFDNKISDGNFIELPDQKFQLNINLEANKFRKDSLGNKHSVELNDWVEIGIYTDGKNNSKELIYLKKHKISTQVTELNLIVDQKPSKVSIDPLGILIDEDMENNMISVLQKE